MPADMVPVKCCEERHGDHEGQKVCHGLAHLHTGAMQPQRQEQYGRKPKIEAIHAGVECGILSGKLPGLDCVSIGPNLLDIHTPRERMEIASVQRVWRFVLEVLKRSK